MGVKIDLTLVFAENETHGLAYSMYIRSCNYPLCSMV
jgi:hypothetical protein